MSIGNVVDASKLTLGNIGQLTKSVDDSKNSESSNGGFGKLLSDAINNLNQTQVTAENDKVQLATGQTDDIAQVMINAQKAETSLQFAVQIRNKVVDAYNEIMRMQL